MKQACASRVASSPHRACLRVEMAGTLFNRNGWKEHCFIVKNKTVSDSLLPRTLFYAAAKKFVVHMATEPRGARHTDLHGRRVEAAQSVQPAERSSTLMLPTAY